MTLKVFILAVIMLYFGLLTSAKPLDSDVEDIIAREYSTVHGRILAVNMATLGKRALQTPNTFERIEENNERKDLHLYQGDIIMDEETEELLHLPNRTVDKRNAVRQRKRLWESRIIPYIVPYYMKHIRKNLIQAIAEFHKHTCLRFVPKQPGYRGNAITFNKKSGCSSKIGQHYTQAVPQPVSIGSGCNFVGTIIHEMLHAVGFWHEQARADRDKYVKINWENIGPGFDDQFTKLGLESIDHQGVSYDYKSIMHYDRKAFTKNGKPTIVAIGNEKMEFGNKNRRLSTKDIIEINTVYDCKTTQYGWTKWSEYSPCNEKCYKTRERYCYHPSDLKYCGGNVNVYGIENDIKKCSRMECLGRDAINGHWGHWSKWTPCSAKCDDGHRTRTRQCNDPPPSKYGKRCPGIAKETNECITKRCNPGPEDTSFEDPKRPFGMWRNKPGYQFKWIRNQWYTKTMDTGPMADHTTGERTGHYLYIESSGKGVANKQARLISPTLTSKPFGKCLKFYYSMYGRTIGSLVVGVRRHGITSYAIFTKKGDQGEGWHSATVDINIPGPFQLELIAVVGQRGYSDIAIDDVFIDDGKCSCQDNYQSCFAWSKMGECQKNKKWMTDNCKRSCNACKYQKCEDSHEQCPNWSNKGECSKNKPYMHKNCPLSCNLCEVPKCRDFHNKCPVWANVGECKKKTVWMYKICAKSCKICNVPMCADSNAQQCPLWAKKGECKKSFVWMNKNCQKSCKSCHVPKCQDAYVNCPQLAKKGDCNTNILWMYKNCEKSCRNCN